MKVTYVTICTPALLSGSTVVWRADNALAVLMTLTVEQRTTACTADGW